MGLKKLKGSNFRAFVDGEAISEESSCQVSLTGNMEDSKTKDSEGSYTQEQMTSRDWSVQVSTFMSTAKELIGIIRQFNSDEKLEVGWDETTTTAGKQNRVPGNAAFARSGQAILNDFSIQADNAQNISVSLQYQGSGALA